MDVTMASPPEDKVRLFRALFRGREDVYARRYVSAKMFNRRAVGYREAFHFAERTGDMNVKIVVD